MELALWVDAPTRVALLRILSTIHAVVRQRGPMLAPAPEKKSRRSPAILRHCNRAEEARTTGSDRPRVQVWRLAWYSWLYFTQAILHWVFCESRSWRIRRRIGGSNALSVGRQSRTVFRYL